MALRAFCDLCDEEIQGDESILGIRTEIKRAETGADETIPVKFNNGNGGKEYRENVNGNQNFDMVCRDCVSKVLSEAMNILHRKKLQYGRDF